MLPVLLAAFVAACPVSPVEDVLREFIAPMTGNHPAWLVETSSGIWPGADQVVKTLWVFSQKTTGDLRITGRRIDGDGTARFQDGGASGTPKDALEIADPDWRRRAWPGNATADLKAAYAFVPNYVIYPSPGCWAFDVEIGAAKTQIVIDIK
jgi:hypothetical protein